MGVTAGCGTSSMGRVYMDFVRSGRDAIGGGGGCGAPSISSSLADECWEDDEAVLPPKLYECD